MDQTITTEATAYVWDVHYLRSPARALAINSLIVNIEFNGSISNAV